MNLADKLSHFATNLRHEEIPQAVRHRAKLFILDAIGIALASSKYEFSAIAMQGIRGLGTGDADVIGFPQRLPLRDAVFMNGLLVHGLDYDDTYLPGTIHLTSSNVPAAIGVAAHAGVAGRDLLTACIVGLETGARIASAANGGFQRVGFHPTGVCAAFSCTLIAGRLLALTPTQLTMAQGIALSTASGSMQPVREGSWTKRIQPGWAAGAGITAASMARAGYTGPQGTYDGHFGLYKMYMGSDAQVVDTQIVTNGLGESWEVMRMSTKMFPGGHLSHALLIAAIGLVREHHIAAEAVESVLTLVDKASIPLLCEPAEIKRRPTTSYMAQFSLQYGVACCIARGTFGLAEIEETAFNDPTIMALSQRVNYESDPNSGYPETRTGEVIIKLKDGGQFRRRVTIHPDDAVSESVIVDKFMANALMAMPEARALSIRDSVLAIEEEPQASRFSRSLASI